MVGKKIRIERILDRNSGKTVIIPMDHGVTVGPVAGLIHMQETIRSVAVGGANAIVMHKGLVETALKNRGGMGLILHLSASTQTGIRSKFQNPGMHGRRGDQIGSGCCFHPRQPWNRGGEVHAERSGGCLQGGDGMGNAPFGDDVFKDS